MFSGKKIIWLLVLIAALAIGYFAYTLVSGTSDTGSTLTSGIDGNGDPEVAVVASTIGTSSAMSDTLTNASDEFVRILSSISDVRLSGGVFNDPVFRDYLQDFSRPLPDRQAGRVNPFAPVTAAELAGVRTSTSSATFSLATSSVGLPLASSTATAAPKKTAPKTVTPVPPKKVVTKTPPPEEQSEDIFSDQ